MPALTLVCSPPCSVVAASAEPRRAAVVLRLANLVVVNQPLPVRAAGRSSSTSERSRLNRHHAASRAIAARLNQAAVHLPMRHVLPSVERTVERVLRRVLLKTLTVPLQVQATVLRPVHRKLAAVLLRVHRSVLLLAVQREPTVLHHVHRSVLLLVVQREPTVLHHVHQSVLQPADQKVLTVPHHVQKHVVLKAVQAVLQPAVPKVPAAATIVAVQTLAKSLN